MKTYRSPKTEIRNTSAIHGRAVFAREPIAKGELVFIKHGHLVDTCTANELEKILGDYCVQIERDWHLCPRNQEEIEDTAMFINHSCDPNLGVSGQVSFVSLRAIEEGEELTYDYATTTTDFYKLECKCGSTLCRGLITHNDWKRSDLQERYGKHFSSYILSMIEEDRN